MVSALTAMRFAIHGREVAVPKLVGLTRAAAEQAANSDGLILEVENHFYSPDVGEGKVISQSPAPGSTVRRGWKVRIAESLGPQKAQVPDLIGQSARAAEMNVHQRGLEIGSIAVANVPGTTQDEIIAQNPPADAALVESPKIDLLVAAPEKEQQFVMPSFVGKRIGDIRQQIEDAGFEVRVQDSGCIGPVGISVPPCTKDSGIVARQFPNAGQRITAGSAIAFELTH